MTVSRLFQPIKVNRLKLRNRIVLPGPWPTSLW